MLWTWWLSFGKNITWKSSSLRTPLPGNWSACVNICESPQPAMPFWDNGAQHLRFCLHNKQMKAVALAKLLWKTNYNRATWEMQRARVQKAEALKTKDPLPQNKFSSCKHPLPTLILLSLLIGSNKKKKKKGGSWCRSQRFSVLTSFVKISYGLERNPG